MIQDSGTRREFKTGAVRDIQEGKGDMVSLPKNAIFAVGFTKSTQHLKI